MWLSGLLSKRLEFSSGELAPMFVESRALCFA